MGSLNAFRAVLTGATALAVIACIVLGEYLAAAVLGSGVAVHTALFIYQRQAQANQFASLSDELEAELRPGGRSA